MLVSIIMPVYNQEAYLAASLDAVLGQSFKNIEVLAINDGSTDKSLSILLKASKYDSRIKIVNQKNQGLLMANVNGIKHATGDYTCFFDPDDQIGPDFISNFIDELDQNYDFIALGVHILSDNSDNPFMLAEDKIFDKSELFKKADTFILDKHLALDKTFYVARWNKLYKTACLKNFVKEYASYKDVSIGEDSLFTFLLLCNSSKAKSCKKINSYYYIQHDNSMTHSLDYSSILKKNNITFDEFSSLLLLYKKSLVIAYHLYYAELSGALSHLIDKDYSLGREFYRSLLKNDRYVKALQLVCEYSNYKNMNALLQRHQCHPLMYAGARRMHKRIKKFMS